MISFLSSYLSSFLCFHLYHCLHPLSTLSFPSPLLFSLSLISHSLLFTFSSVQSFPSSLSLFPLQLSEFVPFLQEICFVHDNMTRRRASQVLANFVDSRAAVGRLRRICMQLRVMLHHQKKVSEPNKDNHSLSLYIYISLSITHFSLSITHSLSLSLLIITVCFSLEV